MLTNREMLIKAIGTTLQVQEWERCTSFELCDIGKLLRQISISFDKVRLLTWAYFIN